MSHPKDVYLFIYQYIKNTRHDLTRMGYLDAIIGSLRFYHINVHERYTIRAGPVFSYKLRYIVGFGLVETIYRNLYENTAPGGYLICRCIMSTC